jgi:hypothetical protein
MRRRRAQRVRSWREHEALIAATEKADAICKRAHGAGLPFDKHRIQAFYDREALEALAAENPPIALFPPPRRG